MNLKKLFRPKSLAVVGGYWADFVIQGNRKLGFKGPIWHVNPKRKSNKKNNCFKSIGELIKRLLPLKMPPWQSYFARKW